MTKGSHTVSVAIIDTGIRLQTSRLTGQYLEKPKANADNGKDDDGNGYIE